jgi:hypothetical protein
VLGTRLVLRLDEFDELLDERTLSCMYIELLMSSIWGTNSALLGQENESLYHLACAFEQELRLGPVLVVRVDNIAIPSANLCRITSLMS